MTPAVCSRAEPWLADAMRPATIRRRVRAVPSACARGVVRLLGSVCRLPSVEASELVALSSDSEYELIGADACMPPLAGPSGFQDIQTACRLARALSARK